MTTSEPRKILVIQLRRIGDVLLTTPAVAALKKRFPGAQLDFLVEAPGDQALEGNPDIGEVLVYDGRGLFGALSWIARIRRAGYDWVVDYMGNPRSALITALSRAKVRAGPAHVAHRWAYNSPLVQSETTRYAGEEKIRVLRGLGVPGDGADPLPRVHFARRPAAPRNAIGLVPASRKETRRWPAASFARLGRLLRERFASEVLVFWGPGERALAEEVAAGIGAGARCSPETPTLKAMAELMQDCRLVVANCNGPKHLAVALGIPTVTIHSSSDPASWTPAHPSHRAVRRDELFCIGCGLNRCPYALECLSGLSPERVFESAARLLESPAAGRVR